MPYFLKECVGVPLRREVLSGPLPGTIHVSKVTVLWMCRIRSDPNIMMHCRAFCFVLLVCVASLTVLGLRCYECSKDKPEDCKVSAENKQNGYVREVDCGSNGSCAIVWAYSAAENRVQVNTLACYSSCRETRSCSWQCVTCCDSDYCNGPPYAGRVNVTAANATLGKAGSPRSVLPTTKATAVFSCSRGLFKCHSQEACLEPSAVCDGSSDCEDDSDELNCTSRSPLSLSTPQTLHPTQSQAAEQPANTYVCPSSNMFLCNTEKVCIDRVSVCDGARDCHDGSDEMHCKTNCTVLDFNCSGVCVPASTVRCDGVVQCTGGVDELGCTAPCAHDLFQCHDLVCVLAGHQCDGILQCGDYSDETNCVSNCSDGEFLCHNGHCVDSSVVCDGGNHCWDWSDELNCAPCSSESLRCWDSVQDDSCYLEVERCDGHFQCEKGRDEKDCGGCHLDYFPCDVTRMDGSDCYETSQLCDGRIDCRQSFIDEFNDVCSDLYYDCSYEQGLFPCLASDGQGNNISPQCYNASQRCDGVANCRPSVTDESGCTNDCDHYCSDTFICWNESERCNGNFFCSDFSDEGNCGSCYRDNEYPCPDGHGCYFLSDMCNRVQNCLDGFDEQDCKDTYRCPSGATYGVSELCNGIEDCSSGEDERGCGVCDQDQFACDGIGQTGRCYWPIDRCDTVIDCPDTQADEIHCGNSWSPYPYSDQVSNYGSNNAHASSRTTIAVASVSMIATVAFVVFVAYRFRKRFHRRLPVAAADRSASHVLPPPYSEVDPESVYFNNRLQAQEQLTFLGLSPNEEEDLPSYEEAVLLAGSNCVVQTEHSEQEVNEPGDESHGLLSGSTSREDATDRVQVQENPMNTVL